MYAPELALKKLLSLPGIPEQAVALPPETGHVLGLIAHMYARIWTPSEHTGVDVRSLPYDLRSSSYIGAADVLRVYDCAISYPVKQVLYSVWSRMLDLYKIHALAEQMPLLKGMVQMVTLAWTYHDGDGNAPELAFTHWFPVVATGRVMRTTPVYVRVPCDGNDRYVRPFKAMWHILVRTAIQEKIVPVNTLMGFLRDQKYGNLNPSAIVALARVIVRPERAFKDLMSYPDVPGDRDKKMFQGKVTRAIMHNWALLYNLPMTRTAAELSDEMSAVTNIVKDLNSAVMSDYALEAAGDPPADASAAPADDAPAADADPAATPAEDDAAGFDAEDATASGDTPPDTLGMPNDNNSNSVKTADTADLKTEAAEALRLLDLKFATIRAIDRAVSGDIAPPLASFKPWIFLLGEKAVTEIKKIADEAISKTTRQK